ncbi:DUF155-domain-containing protein [Sistotremastrum niveocremeum HHB9708]|uniref:DUF155-domain-containing protein n=1 Tax=Sistotremastrum niveocremeum HHB9708 TaxID=1314777 RepID=A0A164XUC2_9AGAM|nr:DUF155-domain-containing protein [Sistotremastrum niveocremeum HHB9708]
MSLPRPDRPDIPRGPSIPRASKGPRPSQVLASIPENNVGPTLPLSRRPSISGRTSLAGKPIPPPKAQRTSKTSQKLVVLPSEPQTKPLVGEDVEEAPSDRRSDGERMSKEQRHRSGHKRLTAYCVAEGFKMKLTAAFLKREHSVTPRVFDDAIYAVYHLPLLPGYGPNTLVRSSVPPKSPGGKTIFARMSEAEEQGYEGMYFNEETQETEFLSQDGFISGSPQTPLKPLSTPIDDPEHRTPPTPARKRLNTLLPNETVAEAVIFSYGVAVFFGFEEAQEKDILEDLEESGALTRRIPEDEWEIEEFHYEHDPDAQSPRIYNDFFTLKSQSHLLKLSIAHAIAQSTLLARFESVATRTLHDRSTWSISRQLAATGKLNLKRRDALRLTGRLFVLRRDVNLVSNVLDVPELFWSEASLKNLYSAVREYLEISGRVLVLNERLRVANELLDIIHEHLNGSAMVRITWIIIWLIVVAIVVELGEVLARLVVHSSRSSSEMAGAVHSLTRSESLAILNRIISQSS